MIVGGDPRSTVIVCWHWFVLPHASVAIQVRVTERVFASIQLVVVFITWTVTALQVSEVEGSVNVQALGASTVRFGWQINAGGLVSRTVMVWVQFVLIPQALIAVQVRAIISEPPQPVVTASE